MLHRLLHMISTADLIKNNPDDWRDKLNERSKSKGKVVLVLFAVILVPVSYTHLTLPTT